MESRPKNPRDFYYLPDAQTPIKADGVLLEFIHDFKTGVPNVFTYRNVFRVGMPFFDHSIKQIAFFGNYLYIAYSDGSFQSATAGGGEKNDALGKILRINLLRQGRLPFTVPPGNPFINKTFMLNEVYALGFRNQHTISFGKDGRIFVTDVGRDDIEETNLVVKGGNCGCSNREGTFVHKSVGGLVTGVSPLYANDAAYGYIYPAAEVGHKGKEGAGSVVQAVAGGCLVENGSPMGEPPVLHGSFHKLIRDKLLYTMSMMVFPGVRYYDLTLGDVVKHDGEQVKGRVDVPVGAYICLHNGNNRGAFSPQYKLQSIGRMWACASTVTPTPSANITNESNSNVENAGSSVTSE
ncbi:Glucose/Sorbosone dehydrogenase [Gracilaria domingensis]|nr:Glucose/Sorbosone dehydrogenase [Gracilaria domingensis]